jgi:prevent-host-death family protein
MSTKPTTTVATAEARRLLKELVRRVSQERERIRLTRYGRTIAGLVSAEDLALLERQDGQQRKRR